MAAVLLGLLCLPSLLSTSEGARGLLALSLVGTFFFLLKRSPSVGAGAVLAFLCLLGGLRRWLIPVFDWAPTDPLLLTAPLLAGLYLLTSRRNYQPTMLTRLLLLMLALMGLEIVNPLQGGIVIGLSGALFYIAPMLWYFIGRQTGTAVVIRRAAQTMIAVTLLAALYGLYQTYFGFNEGEKEWLLITKDAYVALNVGGVTRAFSFFTSSAEYASFLGLGIMLSWAAFLRGYRVALLVIPLLAVALFLCSVRGVVVSTVLVCSILWAVQGRDSRTWVSRGLLALVVAVVGGVWSLGHVQQAQFGSQTAGLVQHQINGLTNSGDSTNSTAGAHGAMIINGILRGFQTPTGMGLGFTTIAGQKFGAAGGNTEIDISNMFVSLGFVGGLIYLAVIATVLSMALRYWVRARSLESLWLLTILLGFFGAWLAGGQYASSVFSWLCIGVLERQSLLLPRPLGRPADPALPNARPAGART